MGADQVLDVADRHRSLPLHESRVTLAGVITFMRGVTLLGETYVAVAGSNGTLRHDGYEATGTFEATGTSNGDGSFCFHPPLAVD